MTGYRVVAIVCASLAATAIVWLIVASLRDKGPKR